MAPAHLYPALIKIITSFRACWEHLTGYGVTGRVWSRRCTGIPAGICISVPVSAGTGAIPAGIYKSINKVLYVII